MSFIKKKDQLQGESAPPSSRPMALQAPPQHPMLRWKGVRATKKADHLDHYVEVRPFASKFLPTEDKYDDMNITALKKKGQELGIPKYSSFKNSAKGKRDLAKLIREAESSGGSSKKTSSSRTSVLGGTASVLGKAAGWAWGSAENKESVKSKFSAMGAASSSFWWCYENPRACASGVVVGGAVGAFAISTAWAWATAFVATAAWYSAIGLAALVLASGTYLAYRTAMLKTYNDGEEYASLSTSELEAKIVELKANQCYRFDVRASCYTAVEHLKAAEDALSFQNKICDGSDCDDVRALFVGGENEGLSEEEQDELVQKRKDLFFGHIWSAHKSADDEKIKELEANNQKELKKLCDDFTSQNKNIFQYKENKKLVKASLTGSRGILAGEYETKDILKVLADKQKEIIGLHATAADEWVELYKAFEGHMKLIKQGDLFSSLPKEFVKKLEKAGEFKPPSSLLSDGDKDEQMRTKLKLERKVINKKVKKMQELVNAIDASEEGSVVARIQEERETKECFINSVGDIRDIFRKHQKKLQKKGALNADIAKAEIALEKPTKELMKRICDGDYPEDALKLAKWVVSVEAPESDKEDSDEEDSDKEDSDEEDSDEEDSDEEDSDEDSDGETKSIDDIFSD